VAKQSKTPTPLAAIKFHQELIAQAQSAGVPAREFDSALKVLVEEMEPLARQALVQLAASDPDAFLKHFINLAEFKAPKLARVEHRVEGALDHLHYVAVERREEPPVLIEGTATDVSEDGK